MIYKLSWNHKGNRATFKDFFECLIIIFQSVPWFFVSTIWSPLHLEVHIWLISSSVSTIQLSVGEQIVGLKFLFWHEIQRSTLQKFADLWDTKCSVTSLATLPLRAFHFSKCPLAATDSLPDVRRPPFLLPQNAECFVMHWILNLPFDWRHDHKDLTGRHSVLMQGGDPYGK
jgi:hypothetical protein